MKDNLTVHYDNEPIYDIVIDDSFDGLADELTKLNISDKKVCIVTESTVGPIYGNEILSIVSKVAKETLIYTFPAGESNKNLNTVQKLYEFLIINHFERKDMLIALGGGVVGDLTGFTAATYLRGISFIQIPTSLLSQVDSSVGGKTGVDFESYKNIVGAFYQPMLVYTNYSTLKTLTKRQFVSGIGEITKAALIKDRIFYEWLQKHSSSIMEYDSKSLAHIIVTSCNIKRLVVENDFKESGERALLNFGHTLGHAIEKIMDFKLLHGECVSLGTVAAAYISKKLGNISENEYNDIIRLHKLYELPVTEVDFNVDEVINATFSDKKMSDGVVKFVVLSKIGEATTTKVVTVDIMKEALQIVKMDK
ncbi:MAG: 3-dehydroquinate synthase [Clostridiales bacterium]|nr:3-dehydroquinate synthase [Clostridiales bacterium]